jgi:putative transposase
MPVSYSIELRERAVRAYEAGEGSLAAIAERFAINLWTLFRWVQRWRTTGSVAPLEKGGGWTSPVDLSVLHAVVKEKPDGTTEELTRSYNQQVAHEHRVHRSSVLRALRRTGYVFKKNGRGLPNRTDPMSTPNAMRSVSGRRR